MRENRNLLWADAMVDEWARSGVRDAALSPGSRSAPLALALQRDERFRLHVIVDERGAGYWAVGRAKATGRPVAAVTTSGTAAVNLHPAAVEAHESGTPLLLVTADRPHELRDVGANQAIDQVGLFGTCTRWRVDLPLPEPTPTAIRHLRQTACRAVHHAVSPGGPVHVNVPMREPLAPSPADENGLAKLADADSLAWQGRPDGSPWLERRPAPGRLDSAEVDRLAQRLAGGRGVIVAGVRHQRDGFAAAARRLAQRLDVPLLADPLSGTRHAADDGAVDWVLGGYDAWLQATERADMRPDWVLRFGCMPTSKALGKWLADPAGAGAAFQLVVDETGRGLDAGHSASQVVHADAARFAEVLLDRVPETDAGQSALTRACQAAEAAAWEALAAEDGAWEGSWPAAVLDALAEGGLLWVGSSLPVRDLDRFGAPRSAPVRVLANRGASGIDGGLHAAAGAAGAVGPPTSAEEPCVAVIGDVAALHDLGGLAAVARHAPHLRVVVIDNGGGAIFRHLPIADRSEGFEELFLTPPRVDWAQAAGAFGIGCTAVDDADGLARALRSPGLVVFRVDGAGSARRRSAHVERVAAVLDGQAAAV